MPVHRMFVLTLSSLFLWRGLPSASAFLAARFPSFAPLTAVSAPSIARHISVFLPTNRASICMLSSSSEYFAVIDEMKVTELKEHLRRLKKPVSGTKGVLQERLKEALTETPVQLSSITAPTSPEASVTSEGSDQGMDVEEEEQLLPPADLGDIEDGPLGNGGGARASPGGRTAQFSRGYTEDEDAYDQTGRGGGSRRGPGGRAPWRADEEAWAHASEEVMEIGQEMDAEVMSFSDLGITVRLDGRYRGLIYEDELDYQRDRQGLRVGDRCAVYVQKVRRDGKVDVSFRKFGTFPKLQDGRQVVWDALLASADGSLPLGDRSDSEEVVAALGISKSQFKAAVGMLYKARQVQAPEPYRITLVPEEERGGEGEGGGEEGGRVGERAASMPAFQVRPDGEEGGWGTRMEGNWDQKREEAKWAPTKVFIRGLPFSLTEEDVHKMMSKIGAVVGIRGMTRRDDGRPSGVAWVEYEEEADAVTAKGVFNGKTFRGRYLEVFSMDEMRSDQHRRGGGGGYEKKGGGGGYERRGGGGRPGGYDRRGASLGGGDWKAGGGQRREFSPRGGMGGSRSYDADGEGEDSWGDVGMGWKNQGGGSEGRRTGGDRGGYFTPRKGAGGMEDGLNFDADLDFGEDDE